MANKTRKLDKFTLSSDRLGRQHAVELLKSTKYRSDTPHAKNDKARKLIRYAETLGQLEFDDGDTVDRSSFLWWLADKCPEVREKFEIPPEPRTPRNARISLTGHSPSVFVTPSDPQELLAALHEERGRRIAAEAELDECRAANLKLEKENARLSDRKKRRSVQGSTHGSQGGRGRAK